MQSGTMYKSKTFKVFNGFKKGVSGRYRYLKVKVNFFNSTFSLIIVTLCINKKNQVCFMGQYVNLFLGIKIASFK